MPNWIKIRTEYETTTISQRKLSEKHGVSFPTLRDRAKREEWVRSKSVTRDKIMSVTLQKAVTKEADRNARIFSLADRLADKLEQAIEQVESYIVTNKTKTKTIEYDYSNKLMKPSKEVIVEIEVKDVVDGIIDKQGLKFLTAALKDIRDIQTEKDKAPDKPDIKDFIDALEGKVVEVWNDEPE